MLPMPLVACAFLCPGTACTADISYSRTGPLYHADVCRPSMPSVTLCIPGAACCVPRHDQDRWLQSSRPAAHSCMHQASPAQTPCSLVLHFAPLCAEPRCSRSQQVLGLHHIILIHCPACRHACLTSQVPEQQSSALHTCQEHRQHAHLLHILGTNARLARATNFVGSA